MSKVVITGASGGLGRAVYRHFSPRYTTTGLCHTQAESGHVAVDLTQPAPIAELLGDLKPELVIHTVGLTDVDGCDRDFAKALAINVHTALHVRQAAEAVGAKVVHVSTNDVFDGGRGMYSETDIPQPVNMYSWTKYMAEQMFYRYPSSLILRFTIMSWFVSGKTSFPTWLCNSLGAGKRVSLFTDQFNSPLYVGTVAAWIEQMADLTGIWHLGSERHSRYEAGYRLAKAMGLDVSLIDTGTVDGVALFAPRPRDVSLDCSKIKLAKGLSSTLDQEIAALVAEQSSVA